MSPPKTNSVKIQLAILDIHHGSDGAAIVVAFNGKRIAVSVFSDHSPQEIVEDRFIGLLGQACAAEDEYEAIIDEVLYVIENAGMPHCLQVAPPLPAPSSSAETLHSLLYPEILNFRLQAVHGRPTIVPISASEAYVELGHPASDLDVDFPVNDNLPKHPSTQVHILEVLVQAIGVVCRVLVDGEVMLCKTAETGLLDLNMQRELESLQKVEKARAASFSASIRVPRLRGYVKYAESGHIIGLLREWIPSGLMDGRGCLRDLDVGKVSRERRRKWGAQLRETVHQLHEIGLVWGDGKIDNIVIDKEDNAWLIDFGGGWTQDWVDRDLAGTVEGDEQALRNIVKFLGVDE